MTSIDILLEIMQENRRAGCSQDFMDQQMLTIAKVFAENPVKIKTDIIPVSIAARKIARDDV